MYIHWTGIESFLTAHMDTLWIIIQIILGTYMGFWAVLFVLPLIPKAIKKLANDPNRFQPDSVNPGNDRNYPVSNFGFFTDVLPGRVKIIERGGTFVRCIMSYEDHAFACDIPGSDYYQKYDTDDGWEVENVQGRDEAEESHPIPQPRKDLIFWIFIPFTALWWVWKRWVYLVTGYVFTGIYPFQMVRTYPLERFEKIKKGDGVDIILRIADYSDHFRVADFQFPLRVPSADTLDKIPVKVFTELMFRVFNPYLVAYQTDDWSARTSAAATDAITQDTRTRRLDDVLSAEASGSEHHLTEVLMRVGQRYLGANTPRNTVTNYGMEMIQALIIDVSVRDPKMETTLGDVAVARVDKVAQQERAKGAAAQLNEQIKVVKKSGHTGLAVLAAERNVRTAAAAGEKGIVVVGNSSDTDPLQAAMLHELKKLNEGEPST